MAKEMRGGFMHPIQFDDGTCRHFGVDLIAMGVELRVNELMHFDPDQLPRPDDDILCEECEGKGTRKNYSEERCGICDGKGHLRRQDFLANVIAAHSDELMYGRRKGRKARIFRYVIDALALLVINSPMPVRFAGLEFNVRGRWSKIASINGSKK
jgi:hypothetical protein